jgi:hypothetical protein
VKKDVWQCRLYSFVEPLRFPIAIVSSLTSEVLVASK